MLVEVNVGSVGKFEKELKKITSKYNVEMVSKTGPCSRLIETEQGNFEFNYFNYEFQFPQQFVKLHGDWRLVAKIDETLGFVNFVNPEELIDIDRKSLTCEHCRVNRRRNIYYLIENTDKKRVTLGSNCVNDYLGTDVSRLLRMYDGWGAFVKWIEEDTEEYGFSGASSSMSFIFYNRIFDIEKLITHAKKEISDKGYVKNEYDEYTYKRCNQGKSTFDHLVELTDNVEVFNSIDIDVDFCDSFRNWLNALNNTNEYTEKIKTYSTRTKIKVAEFSFVASAVSQYLKALSTKDSNFVGEVNKKIDLTLTVVDYKTGDGMYGTWRLWKLQDEQGNLFSKFGEINSRYLVNRVEGDYNPVEIGSVVKFQALVKDHKNFNGVNITEISNLKKYGSKI